MSVGSPSSSRLCGFVSLSETPPSGQHWGATQQNSIQAFVDSDTVHSLSTCCSPCWVAPSAVFCSSCLAEETPDTTTYLPSPNQPESSWLSGCLWGLFALSSLLASLFIFSFPHLLFQCVDLRHASLLTRDFFVDLQLFNLLISQGERKIYALMLPFL